MRGPGASIATAAEGPWGGLPGGLLSSAGEQGSGYEQLASRLLSAAQPKAPTGPGPGVRKPTKGKPIPKQTGFGWPVNMGMLPEPDVPYTLPFGLL